MKFKINNKKLAVLTSFVFLVLPAISFADIVNCGNPGQPDCNFDQFIIMLNGIVRWFIVIIPSLAALSFAYSGAQILFNPGNESKLSDARKMAWTTVKGLMWFLGSWLIIYTLVSALVRDPANALKFLGH